MTDEPMTSDTGIGLAVVLGGLAVAGAVVQFSAPGTVVGAYGFATAMLFGSLLVAVAGAYG